VFKYAIYLFPNQEYKLTTATNFTQADTHVWLVSRR